MTSWSYDLSRMRIFCPAMPSYLFSYRFAAGPRTRACRSRCARDCSRWTDVLSKDLGHIARSMRDGTHGPPQRRWGIRAILSEFHPRVQTRKGALACETTDRVAAITPRADGSSSDDHQETTVPRTRACRKVRSVTSLLQTPISPHCRGRGLARAEWERHRVTSAPALGRVVQDGHERA